MGCVATRKTMAFIQKTKQNAGQKDVHIEMSVRWRMVKMKLCKSCFDECEDKRKSFCNDCEENAMRCTTCGEIITTLLSETDDRGNCVDCIKKNGYVKVGDGRYKWN